MAQSASVSASMAMTHVYALNNELIPFLYTLLQFYFSIFTTILEVRDISLLISKQFSFSISSLWHKN